MAAALLVILLQSMLVALMTGLVTFIMIEQTAPFLERHVKKGWARLASAALLATAIIAGLVGGAWAMISYFQNDVGSVQALLQKMADIIATSRAQLPSWISQHLPKSVDELNATIVGILRDNANKATTIGAHAEHIAMQIVFGVLIGAMVAVSDTTDKAVSRTKPLAFALAHRVSRFTEAFQCILSAQAKISAINTLAVAVFLFVVLPAFGVSLPLRTTIVIVTFVGGLLPVVGGVLANILLVVVALSHSLAAAIVAEIFMITLNKVEFFLNAKFIGNATASKAWEPLVAMLFMYALFGIGGMVVAPFLYAYIKLELIKNNLV